MIFFYISKLKTLFIRFYKQISLLFFDKAVNKFIKHNISIWNNSHNTDSKKEILFELTEMQPNIIAYSYFANVLAKKYDAKIKVYSFGEKNQVSLRYKRLYKSLNAEIFLYTLNRKQSKELEELFYNVTSKLTSKMDVFDLKISGIWLGDLLYDYHMRTYKVPTVDINDINFKNSLKKALYQYIYWRDYFAKHDVKAINVTHCCYLVAIPMRIAIASGIPAYQVNAYGGFYLNEKMMWAYTDFYDYPKLFSMLSKKEQMEGLKLAKKRIGRRFSGEVGVDMSYSTKSAYTIIKKDRVLSQSGKFKILIAAHCFFDSPNGLGPNLFVDFYEWFEFIGYISEKTDYEWYIKTHPDYLPGNMIILDKLIRKYQKFNLIPSDTSHHQLIDEGIDCTLTTYGTIGWEYAALGKLVVNASLSNPHIAYNFNIHPKSVEEYENILMKLPEQKLKIDINEVYEYYYMKLRRDRMSNWLFHDYEAFLKAIGGHKYLFTSNLYKKFIEEFSKNQHKQIISLLNNFIESNDNGMQEKHYFS